MSETPDYFKELTAWRKFSNHAGGTVLASVNGVAHPLRDMGAAYCTNTATKTHYSIQTDTVEMLGARHLCPSLDCTCGFYAYKARPDAERHDQGEILARVSVWGRIAEHARGYRAQFMRIEEIILPAHLETCQKPFEARYGVPVSVDKESGKWTSDSPNGLLSSSHYQNLGPAVKVQLPKRYIHKMDVIYGVEKVTDPPAVRLMGDWADTVGKELEDVVAKVYKLRDEDYDPVGTRITKRLQDSVGR